jgi:hypothetical protein
MKNLKAVSSISGLIAISAGISGCQGLQTELNQAVAQANQDIIASLGTEAALQKSESAADSAIASGILNVTQTKAGGHDIPGTLVAFTYDHFAVNVSIDGGEPGTAFDSTSGQVTASKIPLVTVGTISYPTAPSGFQLQAQVPWNVSWNDTDVKVTVNFPICSGFLGCAVTIPTAVVVDVTNASVSGGTISYFLDNSNHSSVKVAGSVSTSMDVKVDGIDITSIVQPLVNAELDKLITNQLTAAVNSALAQAQAK